MTKNVLVPLDGSEAAERALEYAIETHPDADLTILHVIEVSSASEITGLSTDGEVQQGLEERAAEIFDRAERIAADAGFGGEIETKTGFGSATRSIVDHAEDADVVVMGSAGRHGVSRLLLGSVAETVVRRAPVPVTVVR